MLPVKACNLILLIIINLFFCTIGNAQLRQVNSDKYYIKHFGEDEGLPQNSINSILHDFNDFLWIATEGGLSRFNGNRFISVPVKSNISNNNFTRIKNIYYKSKDTIIAYSATNRLVAYIVKNTIVDLERQERKDGLFFSNLHSPVTLPAYTKDNSVFTDAILNQWYIGDGAYHGTIYDKDTLMVTLTDGIGIYDSHGQVGKIKIDNINYGNLVYLNHQVIYADKENYVNFYTPAGLQKRKLLPIPVKSKLDIYNNSFGNNFFCVADSVLYSVAITASGELNVQLILTNLQNTHDLTVIYQKDSNTIITGTSRNGLYIYKKKFFTVTNPLPNGESDAFYVQQLLSDDHTILAGMNKLFRDDHYIGKTKENFTNFTYSSVKDSKGNYWYSYNNKVLRAREIGIAADTMLTYKGLPNIFFEDRQGRVWFTGNEVMGYFINDQFTEIKISNLQPGEISYMQQGAGNGYFICTHSGLFILDNINDTVAKEVPALGAYDIRFVLPEANGQTWICTYGQGLFLITKDGVTAFPDNKGKLAYVHCIIDDAKGYFWMPTNNGLYVTTREVLMAYVSNRNKLPFYYGFTKSNGLRTNEFNGGCEPAYLRLPNGDISLASMQGLVRFNPAAIDFSFSPSPILVDNIYTDSTEEMQRDSLEIENDVSNISFSLSSSFWGETQNDKLEYQVVAKGKIPGDGAWLIVDGTGIINIFSPSYGDYQLMVRKRKGLLANDYVYKTINFSVAPKWYQTGAFFIARALFFLLLLIGIFRWRRNYYRNANRKLEAKVEAATMELQQMNNTLEKKVEERTVAIQEAEKKFRTLVEVSLVGVYIVQGDTFVYVNPRFEEILGYDTGELPGTNSLLIISEANRREVVEKAQRRLSGEVSSEHYSIAGVKKDGTPVQLEFFGSKTIYEGKPTIIGTMLDITERTKMESELREAEMKFRDLVEKSLVGVYIIKDGKFAYVNPRFAEIFGYSQQELIAAESVNIIVYEPDREIVADNIRKRMQHEIEGVQYEVKGVKKDGSIIYTELFGRITQFEGGPAIIGTLLDITARKKAEEQLIKEKDLSQSIINNLPGIFYIFNKEGRHVLWNKNFETTTGYTTAEISEKPAGSLTDEKGMEVLGKAIEKAYTEGFAEAEAALVCKDGRKLHYYYNGIIVNYNDEQCVLGVGIDISERRKAEEQLLAEKNLSQSIINSLPGVFFIFDANRTHLLWNKNFENVTGYNSEELKGKMAGTCVEEKDLAVFTEAVGKMYATGNAELEVTLINKYKQRIPFYVNGIAITYEGKPCILGIGIDISQRKKAEQERERANYLLNERIKELTTLYRAGLILQREDRSIMVTLHDIVSILPAGWQYPDITAACVKLGELEFCTPNFKPGPFSQSATFTTSTGTLGKIEVVYLKESPQEDEGPFLAEERKLIDMLADMLRIYFIRKEAIDALQKSEANLNTIFENTDTSYALLDTNARLIAFNHQAFDFSKNELKKTFSLHANFIQYFPENRWERLQQSLDNVMKGNVVSYEVSYPQANEKIHWYYVRMFPIINANKIVFGMMVAVSDITEKKLLEQKILDQKIQEQKTVTRAILIGEERERNKIGQELHDNINQILAGTKLYLGTARRNKLNGESIINESIELLDSAIEEIRTLSRGKVTPMKKVNLQEILQTLIDRFHETTQISTSFIYNGSGQLIEDDLKLNIYRVVQEQLNNIHKHAAAKKISIVVEAGVSDIRVHVTDDGKGFDVASKKKGIGLANMVNRVGAFNGSIDIQSSVGNGCSISIVIPF